MGTTATSHKGASRKDKASVGTKSFEGEARKRASSKAKPKPKPKPKAKQTKVTDMTEAQSTFQDQYGEHGI